MMKKNYQLEMEKEFARIAEQGIRPRLLLHSCCAPCSSAVLERLTGAFDITVFYYNPNIAPEEEFFHRAEEQKRLIASIPHVGSIDFLCGNYDSERFYRVARGFEAAPEGGERCTRCFTLRLGETARLARKMGFDYFTTTLSISPLKDAQRLNQIGGTLAERFGERAERISLLDGPALDVSSTAIRARASSRGRSTTWPRRSSTTSARSRSRRAG